MSQHYSNPNREQEPTALPDIETFYVPIPEHNETSFDDNGEPLSEGFYYWYCLPGCLPDSEPIGPFETEEEALQDARENAGEFDEGGN